MRRFKALTSYIAVKEIDPQIKMAAQSAATFI
jgi:hypothetical protein